MCMKYLNTETKCLVVGYENGEIGLWDLESSTMLCNLRVHDEPGIKLSQ